MFFNFKILSTKRLKTVWQSPVVFSEPVKLTRSQQKRWPEAFNSHRRSFLNLFSMLQRQPFCCSDVTLGGSQALSVRKSGINPNDMDFFFWGQFRFEKVLGGKPWDYRCPDLDVFLADQTYLTCKKIVVTEHWALYEVTLPDQTKCDIKFINSQSPGNVGAFTSELHHISLREYLNVKSDLSFQLQSSLCVVTMGGFCFDELHWLGQRRDTLAPVRLYDGFFSVKEDKFFRLHLHDDPLCHPFYARLITVAFCNDASLQLNPTAFSDRILKQCQSHFPNNPQKSIVFIRRILQSLVMVKADLEANPGRLFYQKYLADCMALLKRFGATITLRHADDVPENLRGLSQKDEDYFTHLGTIWTFMSKEAIAVRLSEMRQTAMDRLESTRQSWILEQPNPFHFLSVNNESLSVTPLSLSDYVQATVQHLDSYLESVSKAESMIVVSSLQALLFMGLLRQPVMDKSYISMVSDSVLDPNTCFSMDLLKMMMIKVRRAFAINTSVSETVQLDLTVVLTKIDTLLCPPAPLPSKSVYEKPGGNADETGSPAKRKKMAERLVSLLFKNLQVDLLIFKCFTPIKMVYLRLQAARLICRLRVLHLCIVKSLKTAL